MDRATSTAFCRMSTTKLLVHLLIGLPDDVRVLPALIMISNVATNSVNIASTWSRPANTLIMSELGFAYFLVRIDARNAVKVYVVSLSYMNPAMHDLHRGHGHLQEQFQL